jgi:hypothetical protein
MNYIKQYKNCFKDIKAVKGKSTCFLRILFVVGLPLHSTTVDGLPLRLKTVDNGAVWNGRPNDCELQFYVWLIAGPSHAKTFHEPRLLEELGDTLLKSRTTSDKTASWKTTLSDGQMYTFGVTIVHHDANQQEPKITGTNFTEYQKSMRHRLAKGSTS